MECERSKRLVEKTLVGQLSTSEWETLRAHLRNCDSCRDRYNRFTLADRMLHGGPAALDRLSPGEIGRIENSLFAELDAPRSSWHL